MHVDEETIYTTGTVLLQLLLIPVLDDLPEYQVLNLLNQAIVQFSCYDTRQNVPTLSDIDINVCEEFTILASAALFNGTLGRLVFDEMQY